MSWSAQWQLCSRGARFIECDVMLWSRGCTSDPVTRSFHYVALFQDTERRGEAAIHRGSWETEKCPQERSPWLQGKIRPLEVHHNGALYFWRILYSLTWSRNSLRLWRKTTFHFHGHRSPPDTQINPVHILTRPIYLTSILMLSSHLCLGLPGNLFPSSFSTESLCWLTCLLRLPFISFS